MTPGVRTRIADFHPFEQLAFEVDTSRETLLAAVLDDTFGVVVGERSVIRRFVAGSRQREGVVGIEGRAGDLVDPVRPFAQRERVGIDRTGEGCVLAYVGVVGVAAEIGVVVAVLREFRRVHNVELTGQLGEAHVGLEGDVDLALGAETPLGGDEDDAVCAARTVDRRRGGVLEDGYARDVVGVDVVQVVDGVHHAVDDDQRFVRRVDRARAADADGGRGARLTGGRHEVGSGDTSLKGVVDRKNRYVLDVVHLDRRDRTGQVLFGDLAVTDDHDFVDVGGGVLLHPDGEVRPRTHVQGLGLVTQVRNLEAVRRLGLDGEFAFDIGDCALRAFDDHDRGADQRVAVRVEDGSADSLGLLLSRCRRRVRREQYQYRHQRHHSDGCSY